VAVHERHLELHKHLRQQFNSFMQVLQPLPIIHFLKEQLHNSKHCLALTVVDITRVEFLHLSQQFFSLIFDTLDFWGGFITQPLLPLFVLQLLRLVRGFLYLLVLFYTPDALV
jgi:hypothetical protein